MGSRGRVVLAALCLAGALAVSKDGAAARFAVLVGNDEGQGRDAHLRFSEPDTARLAELLRRLGGFASGGATVLLARPADDLRRALGELAARIRATPGEHLVLVYYSGHADAQALHMGPSVFPLAELKELVAALPAVTRVLILDACQAGVLTQPKGGRPGPGFEVELGGKGEATRGLAILAASSGSELAQESDQLRASVFTHYLGVGLAGLADRNRDGNVSLGEVFDYSADRTLAATLGTSTGPQHPTFRLDLAGRDDVILTRPGRLGAGYGRLRLDVPGWYFVRRGDGSMVAEVTSQGDEALALEPGAYEVTRRERDQLAIADLEVSGAEATAISEAPSRRVAFGRMVRKGGGPAIAYGLAAATTVRSSVEDLGVSMGGALAVRADLSALSLELRLGAGHAQQATQRLSSSTWDLSAATAVLRMRDDVGESKWASALTWGVGVEAGVSYLMQGLDDGARRASWNPFFGPVALAELTLGRRFFLRVDLGVPVYALQVQTAPGATAVAWRPAISSALGAGTSF